MDFIEKEFEPVLDTKGQKTRFVITSTGAIESIKERLNIYRQHETNLINYFISQGFKILEIFADQSIADIFYLFTENFGVLHNDNNQIINPDELKDKRIKLLEDLCLQKHKRVEYPGTNVIYMLTTEEHKKNRIYIIGKAKNLKSRLSTYNKTLEHEVVFYKECKNEEEMDLIEDMVIKKLDKYKEVANRDRFVLPIENELFTDIIDSCVNFFN